MLISYLSQSSKWPFIEPRDKKEVRFLRNYFSDGLGKKDADTIKREKSKIRQGT